MANNDEYTREYSQDNLTVTKKFKEEQSQQIDAVEFHFTVESDTGLELTLVDSLPDSVTVDNVGFHEQYGKEKWEKDGENGTVTFEDTLEASGNDFALYAVKDTEDASPQDFVDSEPDITVDVLESDDTEGLVDDTEDDDLGGGLGFDSDTDDEEVDDLFDSGDDEDDLDDLLGGGDDDFSDDSDDDFGDSLLDDEDSGDEVSEDDLLDGDTESREESEDDDEEVDDTEDEDVDSQSHSVDAESVANALATEFENGEVPEDTRAVLGMYLLGVSDSAELRESASRIENLTNSLQETAEGDGVDPILDELSKELSRLQEHIPSTR